MVEREHAQAQSESGADGTKFVARKSAAVAIDGIGTRMSVKPKNYITTPKKINFPLTNLAILKIDPEIFTRTELKYDIRLL